MLCRWPGDGTSGCAARSFYVKLFEAFESGNLSPPSPSLGALAQHGHHLLWEPGQVPAPQSPYSSAAGLAPKQQPTRTTQRAVAHGIPCPWDLPGKDTGVGCHFLLHRIFSTQGLNPGRVHCRQILYPLNHQGSPYSRGVE